MNPMMTTSRKTLLLPCLFCTLFWWIPASIANEHFDLLLELPVITNVMEEAEQTRYILPPHLINGKKLPGGHLIVDDSNVLRTLSSLVFADRKIDLQAFRKYVDAKLGEYRKGGRILEPPRWDPTEANRWNHDCDRNKTRCLFYTYWDCVVISGQRFRTSQILELDLTVSERYGKSVTFYDSIRPWPTGISDFETPAALVSTNASIKMATKWLKEDMAAYPLNFLDDDENPFHPTFYRCFGRLVQPGLNLGNRPGVYHHPKLFGKKDYQLAHVVQFRAPGGQFSWYWIPADASLAVDVKREKYDEE